MKNKIILTVILALTIISCKAQHIIPVKDGYKYVATEKGFMGDYDYVYIKDVNNTLSKFIGTWKGTYQSENFEFRITKTTTDDGELKEDLLLMRYKITDSKGVIIEDTLILPNDDTYVMQSGYVSKTGAYVFNYIGRNLACGQNGSVFSGVYGVNNDKMNLFLQVKGEMYPECTTGEAIQVLPLEQMELLKQ